MESEEAGSGGDCRSAIGTERDRWMCNSVDTYIHSSNSTKKQGGKVNATIFNAFSHAGVNLPILITVKGRLEVGV